MITLKLGKQNDCSEGMQLRREFMRGNRRIDCESIDNFFKCRQISFFSDLIMLPCKDCKFDVNRLRIRNLTLETQC